MSNRVVHINDNVPDAVYIGRAVPRRGIAGSIWGNPFVVGRDGPREQVIELYRERLRWHPELIYRLPYIRNKPLACWCRHDGEDAPPCHGDVLIWLLDQVSDNEAKDRFYQLKPEIWHVLDEEEV